MIAAKTTATPNADWAVQKAKLKAKFPKITDEDLKFDETRKNEMLTKLQLKTGRTAIELHKILKTL